MNPSDNIFKSWRSPFQKTDKQIHKATHETSFKPVDTTIKLIIFLFNVFVTLLLHLEETSMFLNKTTGPKKVLNHKTPAMVMAENNQWSLEQSVNSSMIFFVNAVLASVSCVGRRLGPGG